MILVGGGAFVELDVLAQQGGTAEPVLTKHVWMVLDAIVVLLLSLFPDLNRAWQISVLGAVAAFIIVIYSIAGSIVGIVDDTTDAAALEGTTETTVTYVQPDSVTTTLDYNFAIMASFGSILFGYGFHQVLPDIQTSLQDHSTQDAKADMRKAITTAFACSYPAYLMVALVGFAAFGIGVSSELMESIQTVISPAAMYPIWIVVIIKTSTEAAVYNQAAFTLTRDICGWTTTTHDDTTEPTTIDSPPRNTKMVDVLMKVIYISCATLVALFLPYVSCVVIIGYRYEEKTTTYAILVFGFIVSYHCLLFLRTIPSYVHTHIYIYIYIYATISIDVVCGFDGHYRRLNGYTHLINISGHPVE